MINTRLADQTIYSKWAPRLKKKFGPASERITEAKLQKNVPCKKDF